MDIKKLLSWIPGWLGFLLLIIVGVAMLVNGAADPFGTGMSGGNRAGFIIFGLCAALVGGFSWIAGGTSEVKGRVGKVGVKVGIGDLPWWGWLVDGVILATSIVLFLAIR